MQLNQLVQKKPSPPTLQTQLKLHKPNIPIQPLFNNMKAQHAK